MGAEHIRTPHRQATPARPVGAVALSAPRGVQPACNKILARGPPYLAFTVVGILAVAIANAALAGDPGAGRKKAIRCQACHGLDGIAKMPNVPHIGGESEFYLTKQLNAFRTGARQDPQMSLMAKNLTDDDIADLAAYYAQIEITARIPDALR